jgi:hypothetical protein
MSCVLHQALWESTYFIGHVVICLLYLLVVLYVCVDDCRGQKRVGGVITTHLRDITESGTIIMTSFDNCQLCISFT